MRKLFGDAAGNDFTFFVPSDAALRCAFLHVVYVSVCVTLLNVSACVP
jgi:hypothetical protein